MGKGCPFPSLEKQSAQASDASLLSLAGFSALALGALVLSILQPKYWVRQRTNLKSAAAVERSRAVVPFRRAFEKYSVSADSGSSTSFTAAASMREPSAARAFPRRV